MSASDPLIMTISARLGQTHYGPDTLRVWAASSDYTSDTSISKQAIDEASNHLFLVRRILRFLSGSVSETTRPITEHGRDVLTLVRMWLSVSVKRATD